MKHFYKSYAPDISTGSTTTIKDVGKRGSTRKFMMLWSFLLGLLMMVPTGAKADGTGSGTAESPYKGDIGYKTFSTANGSVYLEGVTGGQLHIQANGVTVYVAGNNTLSADNSNNGHPALELGSKNVFEDRTFTIKYWSKDNQNPATLRLNAAAEDSGGPVGSSSFPGFDLHDYTTNFTINGPVIVRAFPADRWGAYDNSKAFFTSKSSNITLKNGAYFAYTNDYKASQAPDASNWTIENFASAGHEVATLLTSKKGITVNAGSLSGIKTSTIEGLGTFYSGKIGDQMFVAPQSGTSFKLLVNENLSDMYGEVFTNTTPNYPFPIRTDNSADGIQPNVNVGAAAAGETYYGQLTGQTTGNFNLNVTQYPHSGTLNASTGNITLSGTDAYKTLNTVTEGFTLSASNNNTLTLKDLLIPTRNIVYVSGDVRLDRTSYMNSGLTLIGEDVTKFNNNNDQEESVYYCLINYANTDLQTENDENEADIKIFSGDSQVSYPFIVDPAANIIYAWLPANKDFKIGTDANSSLSLAGTKKEHYQLIYAALPVIHIDRDGSPVNYNRLSDAFADVKSGETIYFSGDYKAVDGGEAQPKDNNITDNNTFTLDFKGYTLSIKGHLDKDGKYPLISSGKGKLILASSGSQGGGIDGEYRINGIVYTDLSDIGNPHVEGIAVKPKMVSTTITHTSAMPDVITYNINGVEVNAAKHASESKYCLWIPTENETLSPVQDANGTIFAQIQKDNQGTYTLDPLFDLDSHDIKVTTTSVEYANGYTVTDYGTEKNPATIVTLGENNYAAEIAKTLTVQDGAYVILKNIYSGLQKTDGTVNGKQITTKLVTEVQTGSTNIAAHIQTIGINSIGTITIADNSTLEICQAAEAQDQANALRFFSINKDATTSAKLNVESGTLLAYLESEADAISNVIATYKAGSVRASFGETNNTARFKNADNKDLYRITFSVPRYYEPYTVEYTTTDGTVTIPAPLTSDKNGEIHLWLPEGVSGTAKFSRQADAKEISFSRIAKNDNNIAPASVVLYPVKTDGSADTDNKIGAYNSLDAAFTEIGKQQNGSQFIVALIANHSESNTTCKVPETDGKQVTIDLNGYTLNCHNVAFETNANNFLLVTNNVSDDEKHATISGDITVSQNVYISKNVHMEGIHVDMINPTSGEENYENVRRLLVKGLTYNNEYTYEFDDQQVGFTVKQKEGEGEGKSEIGLACLWLVESMTPKEFVVYPKDGGSDGAGLTVPGGELAIVAHSNGYTELVKGGVVATIGDQPYKTLSSAIVAANSSSSSDGESDVVITLLENIQSQATFCVTGKYAINLNGHDLTFTQGGFTVTGDKAFLTIKDSKGDSNTDSNTDDSNADNKGILAGVIKLNGKDKVSVDPNVTIGGVVVDASKNPATNIYRLVVNGGKDASLNVWVETPERDTDKEYEVSDNTYEYTIPAGLANHQTTVKGYKKIIVDATTSLDNVKGCNVVVNNNITWAATGTGTIHHLTIYEGGKVTTTAETKITATDGIRYVHTFDANKWSLIALPFTATDITTTVDDKVVSLSPAANPGTSGHFWLHTIKNDGSTTDVTESEMTANKVYVMKVPENQTKTITFVSGPNQMLYREKVLNPDPVSGFIAYANGTLDNVTLDKPFYTLQEDGDEQKFVRVTPTTTSPAEAKADGNETTPATNNTIAPFSGYLLADAATTEKVASFSLRSTPTANEDIVLPEEGLQVRTEKGRIILTAEEATKVIICDMAGVVKFHGEIPAGDSSFEVGTGIHIVNNHKVIVK